MDNLYIIYEINILEYLEFKLVYILSDIIKLLYIYVTIINIV